MAEYTNCSPCYTGYPNLFLLGKTYTGFIRSYLLSSGSITIPFSFKVPTCCYPNPDKFKIWKGASAPASYAATAYADDVSGGGVIQLQGTATNIGTISYTTGLISGSVTIASLTDGQFVWFGWEDNCGNQHVQKVAIALDADPCPNPIPVSFTENCFGLTFTLNCPLDFCGEDVPTIYEAGVAIGYLNKAGEFVQTNIAEGQMPTIFGGLVSTPQSILQGYSLKHSGEVWLAFREGYECGKVYELRVGEVVVSNDASCVQTCTYTSAAGDIATSGTLDSLVMDGAELVDTPLAYASAAALKQLISDITGIPLTSITVTAGTPGTIAIIKSAKEFTSYTVNSLTAEPFTRSACQ